MKKMLFIRLLKSTKWIGLYAQAHIEPLSLQLDIFLWDRPGLRIRILFLTIGIYVMSETEYKFQKEDL